MHSLAEIREFEPSYKLYNNLWLFWKFKCKFFFQFPDGTYIIPPIKIILGRIFSIIIFLNQSEKKIVTHSFKNIKYFSGHVCSTS